MANITTQNLPDYIRRFGKLIDIILAKPHGTLIHINSLDSTPQSTSGLLSQTLKAIIEAPSDFSHDYSIRDLARLRSSHSFRIRRGYVEVAERSVAYNKIHTVQYDHFRGIVLAETHDEFRPQTDVVDESEGSKIACSYDPETFLALCHLRNVGILLEPPTLSGVVMSALPDHSSFTNIAVVESSPGNIIIL